MKNILLFCLLTLSLHNAYSQWTKVLEINPQDIFEDMEFFGTQTGYACYQTGLYKTTDGGDTWYNVPITNSVLKNCYLYRLAVIDTNIVFVSGYHGTGSDFIAKSLDGGRTWVVSVDPGGSMTSISSIMDIQFVNKENGFAVSKSGLLYTTTNAGTTWTYKKCVAGGSSILLFLNKDTGIVAYNSTIQITFDAGATWKSINLTTYIHKIDLVDGYKLILSHYDGITVTNDFGNSWQSFFLPNSDLYMSDFVDGNVGYSGDCKTYTGGLYWEEFEKRFYASNYYMFNKDVGIAYSLNIIHKTTNGGGPTLPIVRIKSPSQSTFCFGDSIVCKSLSNPSYSYDWYINGSKVQSGLELKYKINSYKDSVISLVGSNGYSTDTANYLFSVIKHDVLPVLDINYKTGDTLCENVYLNVYLKNYSTNALYKVKHNGTYCTGPNKQTGSINFYCNKLSSDADLNIYSIASNTCYTDTVVDNIKLVGTPGLSKSPFWAEDSLVCKYDSTFIVLKESRRNVKYQLKKDNGLFGNTYLGNGGDLKFPTGKISQKAEFKIVATDVDDTYCSVTSTSKVIVDVDSLMPNYVVNKSLLMTGDTLVLTNTSKCDTYRWGISTNLGLGYTEYTQNVVKLTSLNAKLYNVSLFVESTQGCKDSLYNEYRFFSAPTEFPLSPCYTREIEISKGDTKTSTNTNNLYQSALIEKFVDRNNNLYIANKIAVPNTTYIYSTVYTELCKYDETGRLVWKKELNLSKSFCNKFLINKIYVDSLENVFFAGTMYGNYSQYDTSWFYNYNNNKRSQMFLGCINSSGSIQWINYSICSNTNMAGVSDIRELSNGHLEILLYNASGNQIVFTNGKKQFSNIVDFVEIDKGGNFINFSNGSNLINWHSGVFYGFDFTTAWSYEFSYHKSPLFINVSNEKQLIFSPDTLLVIRDLNTHVCTPFRPKGVKVISGRPMYFNEAIYHDNALFLYAVVGNYNDGNVIVHVNGDIIRAQKQINLLLKVDISGTILWYNASENLFIKNLVPVSSDEIVFAGQYKELCDWNSGKIPENGILAKGQTDLVLGSFNPQNGHCNSLSSISNENNDFALSLFKDHCGDLLLLSEHSGVFTSGIESFNNTSQHAVISKYSLDNNCFKKKCVDFSPSLSNDIGVFADSTSGYKISKDSVALHFKVLNYGLDTISSFQLSFMVDGKLMNTQTQGVTLLPNRIKVYVVSVKMTSVGKHDVRIVVSNPNNQKDLNGLNDTLKVPVYFINQPLAGTYTIGPHSTGNFPTIKDAISALYSNGISSSVLFNILPGTYHEQLVFHDSIVGSSILNKIVFSSSTNDSSDVIISFSPNSLSNNSMIYISSLSNILFKDITFKIVDNPILDYCSFIELKGKVQNVVFEKNQFIGLPLDGNGFKLQLINLSNSVLSLKILNNSFKDIMGGIYLYTIDSLVISGNSFTNIPTSINIMVNTYALIHKNKIQSDLTNYFCGVQAKTASCSSLIVISSNEITFPNSISSIGISVTGKTTIKNNMIRVAKNAIIINNSSCSTNVLNNTTYVFGIGDVYSIVLEASSTTILNNIFVNTSGAPIFDVGTYAGFAKCDYNCYSYSGNIIAKRDNDNFTFTQWKAIDYNDSKSVLTFPWFVSSDDMHIIDDIHLNNSGLAVLSVTDDIDGDVRNATKPDIGADEFDISYLLKVYSANFITGSAQKSDTIYLPHIDSCFLDYKQPVDSLYLSAVKTTTKLITFNLNIVQFGVVYSFPYSIDKTLADKGGNILKVNVYCSEARSKSLQVITLLIAYDFITDIHVVSSERAFSIYPNPITNQLFIRVPSDLTFSQMPFEVSIVNELGQVIDTYFERESFVLSEVHWPNGVYYVKIITDKNVFVAKLIKQ